MSKTPLAEHLRANPQKEIFVDFHYYPPSDEAAAFFIEPIKKQGEHIGWIVLQITVQAHNDLTTRVVESSLHGCGLTEVAAQIDDPDPRVHLLRGSPKVLRKWVGGPSLV